MTFLLCPCPTCHYYILLTSTLREHAQHENPAHYIRQHHAMRIKHRDPHTELTTSCPLYQRQQQQQQQQSSLPQTVRAVCRKSTNQRAPTDLAKMNSSYPLFPNPSASRLVGIFGEWQLLRLGCATTLLAAHACTLRRLT